MSHGIGGLTKQQIRNIVNLLWSAIHNFSIKICDDDTYPLGFRPVDTSFTVVYKDYPVVKDIALGIEMTDQLYGGEHSSLCEDSPKTTHVALARRLRSFLAKKHNLTEFGEAELLPWVYLNGLPDEQAMKEFIGRLDEGRKVHGQRLLAYRDEIFNPKAPETPKFTLSDGTPVYQISY